ncbi:MAG: prepilin-type N-terminal cleavage/methylation domain-containing protein [Desulfosalsimonadaceae bacterium]|nr:prepilin-type N-terminal cleavage/methylation domain-containing protein [Desulfosalsimonadaceae bacterium]
MLQKLRGNTQGFTLIELMIVIAIIGILAAIAIPNFIAYRNKSFCSAAESDANSIAAAIADYFAIPSHTETPTASGASTHLGVTLSGQGDAKNTVTVEGGDPNDNITIEVIDNSGRCPTDYMSAQSDWDSGTSTFTKNIKFNTGT